MAQRNAAASRTSSVDSAIDGEVSLVRGGPFYRAQQAARLIESNRWNLGRRIVFAVAVTWVPLLLITLLFNPHAIRSLLGDYLVNARILFAVPVLLVGQLIMEQTFRAIARHVREAGLLLEEELIRLDAIIGNLMRLRDSMLPELLILAAVYVHVALFIGPRLSIALPWAVISTGTSFHASPAGWYGALVSGALYEFLLGLSLWKWLLWSYFLLRLSRLNLQVVATHPDHHGGLGFLGLSPIAAAPIAVAVSAAIASVWRAQILHHNTHLMDYKFQAVALLVIVLLIFMGPLVFFMPRLGRLRQRGILEYGTLAQMHSMDFQQKWIVRRAGHEDEFLDAPEVSTLTDLATSYDNIEHMQPFPFDKVAFFSLLLAVVLPMLPVVLAEIPLSEVLKALFGALK